MWYKLAQFLSNFSLLQNVTQKTRTMENFLNNRKNWERIGKLIPRPKIGLF